VTRNQAEVESLSATLRSKGTTLRGKMIEGMTETEELAAVAADDRMEDPAIAALYDAAVKRRKQRFWLRFFVIVMTLCGAGLAVYAVVDFSNFTAQASALALLDTTNQNITSEFLKFAPPNRFNDIAVRSQCSLGGMCYSNLLQKGNNKISQWDFVLVSHQPEADLNVLTSLITASLIMDFIALIMLAIAMTFSSLEQQGKIRRKLTRPYCSCCGKRRRIDILIIVDMFLALASLALFLACVGVAFSNPIATVPFVSAQKATPYTRASYDNATGTTITRTFFTFAETSQDIVKSTISNFDIAEPNIT
jgi:hypothetical protein